MITTKCDTDCTENQAPPRWGTLVNVIELSIKRYSMLRYHQTFPVYWWNHAQHKTVIINANRWWLLFCANFFAFDYCCVLVLLLSKRKFIQILISIPSQFSVKASKNPLRLETVFKNWCGSKWDRWKAIARNWIPTLSSQHSSILLSSKMLRIAM